MTTEEIQHYVDEKIGGAFDGYTSKSLEMMTSEGGDGRFFGKVFATVYLGLPQAPEVYLAIGQSEKGVQLIKFGRSECVNPSQDDLEFVLKKELGIEGSDAEG